MENLYFELIKEVEKVGVLTLAQRKRLWKEFENFSLKNAISGKSKRIKLAIECIRKVINNWDEVNLKECVNNILRSFDIENFNDNYKEHLEEFYSMCEKEVARTNNFSISYLQQAVSHFIQIVEDDETLIDQDYVLIDKDNDLEFDELDTSYCTSIVWKYQDMRIQKEERNNKEKDFWIWYVKEAAKIQGIKCTYESDIVEYTQSYSQEIIESLEELVKKISSEYEFISYEKKNMAVILGVLNLNDNAVCPVCKMKSSRFKNFFGMMDIGKIRNWKIQLKIKERLYYCDNSQCKKENFIPNTQVDYKEKKANFSYVVSVPENEERICKFLDIN